jgi:hypothetical protein
MWDDPLPEFGDWIDFLVRRVPGHFLPDARPDHTVSDADVFRVRSS